MLAEPIVMEKETSDFEDDKIHSSLSGNVTNKDLSDLVHRMITMSDMTGTKSLLIDLRNAKIPESAYSAYRLPAALEQIGLTRYHRIAFLLKQSSYELDFYETVFLNRGFTFKIFTDYEEASLWLAEPNQRHRLGAQSA